MQNAMLSYITTAQFATELKIVFIQCKETKI